MGGVSGHRLARSRAGKSSQTRRSVTRRAPGGGTGCPGLFDWALVRTRSVGPLERGLSSFSRPYPYHIVDG